MARIIYGVAGQGFGHSMRSRVVIDYLKSCGHEVVILAYSQSYDYLSRFYPVREIAGINLVYKNNTLYYGQTILSELLKFPAGVKSFIHLVEFAREFKPDIIFSDYEPSSSLVANYLKVPLVSIGNHHFITNTHVKFPKEYLSDYLAVKVVTDFVALRARAYLVMAFCPERVRNKKTFLFKPLVQSDVKQLQPQVGESILIYLTSQYREILDVLVKRPEKFIIYGLDEDRVVGNVTLKKFSRENFIRDLSEARALIANAGFSLMSEALYYRKPLLALPLKHQFEQIINAIYLKKCGYGDWVEEVTSEAIEKFLGEIDSFTANLANYDHGDSRDLFNKVDELINLYIKK